MLKNTASQRIGAQMITAADGTNFTGTVTVLVTIDAGTQTTGTVGSGICTHEGNGYHTYAPSQAETNGDLLAFTFTGTGAISATVQVYTVAGDPFTRLGAPVGASISADIAGVQADTDNIQTRLPAALVGGRMDASIGAVATGVIAAASFASGALDAVWSTVTRTLTAGTNIVLAKGVGVTGFNDLDAAGTRSAIGLAAANLDTQLTTIDDFLDTEVAAIKAKTDQMTFTTANRIDATAVTVSDKTGYTLSSAGIQAIWDALTSALTTVGSIGKLLVDNINATISSRLASASYTAPLDAAGTRTAVGLASADLDTQLSTIDNFLDTEIAAIKAKTDQLVFTTPNQVDARAIAVDDKTGYAIGVGGIGATAFAAGAINASALAADAVDEILDETIGDSTITVRQALKLMVAAMGGKVSGSGTSTITIRNAADTTDVIVATVDGSGNRSAITLTL